VLVFIGADPAFWLEASLEGARSVSALWSKHHAKVRGGTQKCGFKSLFRWTADSGLQVLIAKANHSYSFACLGVPLREAPSSPQPEGYCWPIPWASAPSAP
jgi:hypothetical protein